MELIDVDVLQAQTPQAALQGLAKMFGASVLQATGWGQYVIDPLWSR